MVAGVPSPSSSPPRAWLAVASVSLLAALTACGDGTRVAEPMSPSPETTAVTPGASAPAPSITGEPSEIASGLEAPWSVVFVRGTTLVSERDSGRIVELGSDGSLREVASIEGVVHGGEGGLLGLAVDGSDLFVYSTGADGNRIERYPVAGEPGSFSLGAPTTLVDGIPAGRTHNGGRLAIGPDGLLYASVGDAGNRDSAQDPDALGGKILRMTRDGEAPEDNPFPDSLVYSLGHRNVQGLAWTEDGTMFATEFGQDTWDELNVIEPGANHGWPMVEGAAGDGEFTDPVQQWSPGDASPSGITIVGGTIVIANLRGESLRLVPTADPSRSTTELAGAFGRVRDVVLAPDGHLWFLTNNTDGRGAARPGDDRILAVPIV